MTTDTSTAAPSLTEILTEACDIARRHGLEAPIGPDDFGIHRSDTGNINATYVDSSFAVTVWIEGNSEPEFRVAELDWVHCEDLVETCEVCEAPPARRSATAHLPGDAPETSPAPIEFDRLVRVAAVRGAHGEIRRRSDGLFIADAGTTVEQLQQRISRFDGDTSRYALATCYLYRLAIELIEAETEAADAAVVDTAEREFVAGLAERMDLDAGLTAIVGADTEAAS